jgi:hypothetical protein
MSTSRPGHWFPFVLVLVALLSASFVVVSPAVGAQTTCFGQAPTLFAVPGQTTTGTSGADVIVGTNGPDVIRGLGGNDRICSKGGADEVDGGGGNDRISLGSGADVARGGSGDDIVHGKSGADRLFGNEGADKLIGGNGRDHLSGGRGHDVVEGNRKADTLVGGKGRDTLNGGKGKDMLRGNGGSDTCTGGTGLDTISGCESQAPAPAPIPAPTALPTAGPAATPTPTATPVSSVTPIPTPTATASPTATPTPGTPTPVDQLGTYIDTTIVGTYGGAYPWISQAWSFVQAQGTVIVADIGPPLAGQVGVTCGANSVSLGSCYGPAMTIDDGVIDETNTIIHELAHVYELSTGVVADPGPLGMAQLYFMTEWEHLCNPSEIFADTLLHVTKSDASLSYYLFACPSLAAVTTTPTAEAEAVVTSMLAGTDPAWFAATYANGAEAWADVMTLGFTDKVRVVTNLANEFGGYCSAAEAMQAAFFSSGDPNPWADGGCP